MKAKHVGMIWLGVGIIFVWLLWYGMHSIKHPAYYQIVKYNFSDSTNSWYRVNAVFGIWGVIGHDESGFYNTVDEARAMVEKRKHIPVLQKTVIETIK